MVAIHIGEVLLQEDTSRFDAFHVNTASTNLAAQLILK